MVRFLATRPALATLATYALLGALGSLSCDKKSETASPDPASTASATSAALPAKPVTSGAAGASSAAPAPMGMDQSFAGRLVQESKTRPGLKPSVEDVFAMAEGLGAAVPTKQQTIAATYKASYCVGGFTTSKKLSINVCEYPDEAAATAGMAVSNRMFKSLTRRTVYVRKATTMALFETDDAPDKALEKKLTDAFLAM